MAGSVNVPALASSASPLFLREPEVRHGIELLFFAYGNYIRAVDRVLAHRELGRAHQRALYFISRRPDLTVSDLLAVLAITKQSLGRVLTELTDRGLIDSRPGERDRRQRLLRLTSEGDQVEREIFEAARELMASAYGRAGQDAVSGFWRVLEALMSEESVEQFTALQR